MDLFSFLFLFSFSFFLSPSLPLSFLPHFLSFFFSSLFHFFFLQEEYELYMLLLLKNHPTEQYKVTIRHAGLK